MKKKQFRMLVLFFLLLSLSVFAEVEASEAKEAVDYLPIDPATVSIYVFALVLLIAALSLLLQNRLSEKTKKIFFIIIAATVVLATLYVSGSTVFLNLVSASQGPIHWHADFEIWLCGENVTSIAKPEFPRNKVGNETLHHHNDFRIHVEGLVVNKQDVSLGRFFQSIGGGLTKDSIIVPLENGEKLSYTNGMLCPNGKTGKLRLLVMNSQTAGEFVERQELDEYTISPFFTTIAEGGQGDLLKIVFETEGEKK